MIINARARPPKGTDIILVASVATLWHLPRGANPEGLNWPTLCGLSGGVYAYGPWAEEERHACTVCAARAPKGLLETPQPPRRPIGNPKGKYRKITEPQVRALHLVHWEQRVPINELGRRYWQQLGFASANGCANTLSRRFIELELQRHDRIAMTVQASTKNGLSPRDWKTRKTARLNAGLTQKGKQRQTACVECTRPAQVGSDRCYSHDPAKADQRAVITAQMRALSPLQNRDDLEDAATLVVELVAFRGLGGRWRDLSREAEVPEAWLSHVAHGKQERVAADRVNRIRAALRELTAPGLARAA